MGKVSACVIVGEPDDVAEVLERMKASQHAKPEALEPLEHADVAQAMRRFAVRISGKENATPAELEAMTEAANF